MKYQIPPGVFDLIPEDEKEPWKSTYLWNYVERQIRHIAKSYGFEEIRTPLFERTELFQRSVGETSDIVSKEMYTFLDRGERSLSLRPEGTAPVMRAFLEKNLDQKPSMQRLFYVCPMFRYERAQAGRYRQHHQFGVEAIGNASPEQDAEVIDLLFTLLQELGLKGLELQVNSLGSNESRDQYREALRGYLRPFLKELSEDSQKRFELNPLRILDSKAQQDIEILKEAPSILDHLTPPCREYFETVCARLALLNIPYKVNPRLVRGLDYYNHTVFEVIAGELGAQNSLGGGGRYDGLISSLGGPDLPSIGFGAGIERIIQTMLKQGVEVPKREGPLLFLIPLGDEARELCFFLQKELRKEEIPVQMDLKGRKVGKAMQYANVIGAQYVAVVGDDEMANKRLRLREMSTGQEEEIPLADLAQILSWELNSDHYKRVWRKISAPFASPAEQHYFLKKTQQTIEEAKEFAQHFQIALEKINELWETTDDKEPKE